MKPDELQAGLREILGVAENLEALAAASYRRAGEGAVQAQLRDALIELAEMEERHLATLRQLRAGLAASAGDLEQPPEVVDFLSAWLESIVFPSIDELTRAVETVDTLDGWLRTSVAMEKESIAYYAGLRLMLPAEQRWAVEEMIQEELQHLVALGRLLAEGGQREASG